MRTPTAWLLALLLWLGASCPAAAHLSPNSVVSLDFRRDHVDAEALIPAGELNYALEPGASRAAYLLAHFGAAAPDGRPWHVEILAEDRLTDAWGSDLRFRLRLTPPPGAAPARLRLRDDAVTELSANHYILIFVRTDFRSGVLAARPHLLGALQQPRATLDIDRSGGNCARGFLAALALGSRHFLEGRDHQLFLIALMLPAPLVAAGGRWDGRAPRRRTLRALALLISAFTLGHSLTLIAAAFLGWSLSAVLVEPLIALSVLVSAAHALRPLFAGREPWVAGGFGLVHGLAFARVISAFSLDLDDKIACILGFNLGIEAIQLLVAGLASLPMLVLAATPFHPIFRRTSGGLILAVASLWLIERLATAGGGWPALDRWLDWSPLAVLVVGLALLGMAGLSQLRRQVAVVHLEIAPQGRNG